MQQIKPSATFTVKGSPIPKPRMSRSDVWNKRPIVVKYRAWCDEVRCAATKRSDLMLNAFDYDYVYLTFRLAIPPSASKKDAQYLQGNRHRVRPDLDNLVKGVLDALFDNDSAISSIHAEKFYVNEGEAEGVDVALLTDSSLGVP